jgi:hypothetical protein
MVKRPIYLIWRLITANAISKNKCFPNLSFNKFFSPIQIEKDNMLEVVIHSSIHNWEHDIKERRHGPR